MRIPNIKCDCGRVIQQRTNIRVTCVCGRRWLLCKAAKDISVKEAQNG